MVKHLCLALLMSMPLLCGGGFKEHFLAGALAQWYSSHTFLKVKKSRMMVSPPLFVQRPVWLVWYLHQQQALQKNKRSFRSAPIRVLLDETQEYASWQLSAKEGFILITKGKGGSVSQLSVPHSGLKIEYRKGSIFINDSTIPHQSALIISHDGIISHNKSTYEGTFLVTVHGKSCFLINQLDLEAYVYGVLRSESWPGWPLEVNKAFAIASRSYAVTKMLEHKASKKPFHIKNTNIHQTYQGTHDSPVLKKAVEETHGVILTYEKKPILAMFDCCCGGIIPAHMDNLDFKKAPYLARTVACTFCKPSKIYRWEWEIDLVQFTQLLQSKGITVQDVQNVSIEKKDKAGVVHKVIVHDKHQKIPLSGKMLYSFCTKIKSYCYSVKKRYKKLCFVGQGFGHNVGICQWGARNMVDRGWNYQHILQFFYPGTAYMKLQSM